MNNSGKSNRRSRGVAALMESVAEIQQFAERGMSVENLKHHYRRHHPDRIRARSIPGPGKHSPAAVRKLRLSLGISQPVFAELIGVSGILVQSWERGVRKPSPLARRLLDTISRDPGGWLAGLHGKGRPGRAGWFYSQHRASPALKLLLDGALSFDALGSNK
jgi:DNA-binding XRE family transcriptional regulator